jgi:uncharacterized glyoxalase superfamily protein PhnB
MAAGAGRRARVGGGPGWDFDDLDAHYTRARAAGADIVRPLAHTGYGTREYGARDLEGHYWYFGTYRPA